MTEPRIRQRQKGQQFPAKDLSQILHAFGDTHTDPFLAPPPSTTTTPSQLHPPFTSALPTTISTLDEIITDFIIETCHEAASIAAYSRRQKIKLDDFKFMLRRDGKKLGRVSEMMEKDRELKRQRQTFDTKEGVVGPGGKVGGVDVGKEEEGRKRGRRKRRREGDEESVVSRGKRREKE